MNKLNQGYCSFCGDQKVNNVCPHCFKFGVKIKISGTKSKLKYDLNKQAEFAKWIRKQHSDNIKLMRKIAKNYGYKVIRSDNE